MRRRLVDADDGAALDEGHQRPFTTGVVNAGDGASGLPAAPLRLDEDDGAAAFQDRAERRVAPREPFDL